MYTDTHLTNGMYVQGCALQNFFLSPRLINKHVNERDAPGRKPRHRVFRVIRKDSSFRLSNKIKRKSRIKNAKLCCAIFISLCGERQHKVSRRFLCDKCTNLVIIIDSYDRNVFLLS